MLPAEDRPYAQAPAYATAAQESRYLENFAKALELTRQKDSAGPEEKYLRDRITAYLRSSFDPRPFAEIEEDIRSIVASELSRI